MLNTKRGQEFLTTGPTCEGCKTGVSNLLCRHRQGISRHSERGLRRRTDVDAFHCRFTQRPWLFFDHTTSEAQQSGGAAMLQPTRRSAARPHHRRSAPSEHGHEAFRMSPHPCSSRQAPSSAFMSASPRTHRALAPAALRQQSSHSPLSSMRFTSLVWYISWTRVMKRLPRVCVPGSR